MADTSEEVPKYEICFIQTGESPEESTEILKHAFEAVNSNQFEPVWVTVSECLKISKKEPKLFVVDPFEGLAFEHLKTFQCRIIGPLSILYCLQYGEVLPKRSYPIYSVSMRKITVACSNIPAKLREEISSRVQLMGGFFSKDLTKSVSHLIVGEVGSQKYKVAANCGLPIMLPEWVSDVWENGQYKQLHATDSCFDKYKCPVFKGLVITVSQLSAEERLAVKRVVEENGGSYLGALKANETTHLILNEPTGDKYRFAKNWNVIIVNVRWIYESVESGYCRDEKLYGLDMSLQIQPKRSTPKKNNTLCDMPLVDCSIVSAPAVSHLDETMKSDISILVTSRKDSFVPLDEFNLSSLPKYGQFLDGCKIFLTGFSPQRMDKLRKIVNSGGGMRFNKYSDSISHVVCGELADDLLQNIRSSSVKPFVVNYKWLLECCKNSTLVDEKPYLCVDVTTLSPEKNPEKEQKKDVPIHMSQNSSQTKKDDFTTNENMTDIFRQYINGQQQEDDKENKEDFSDSKNINLKSKTLTGDFRKSSSNNFEEKCNELPEVNVPVIDLENVTQAEPLEADNDVELLDDDTSCTGNLFAGMKFTIVGFGEKDSEILSGMIEAHAGVITSQRNEVDIAIVPLIWHDLTIPVSNIVTNCWLQKCIEESRIFDFDENELFRPFDLAVDKKPFESLVISISQYAGTERDCLIHLSESLGATCQEYFVRKANANKGVLANTHLVVSVPDGSKYEASKKWKIPAVTKQWVIDAAKMGMAPQVEDYLVEKFPDFPRCEEDLKTTENTSVMCQKVENNNSSKNKSHRTPSTSHLSQNPSPVEPCVKEHSKSSLNLQANCVPDIETVECDKKLQTAKEGTPCIPIQHSRVAELCNESRRENIKMSSPVRDTSLDASLNLDQTTNFKFNVSGMLRDLDASGARDSFASNKSLPVEEMFGRNLAIALQRFGDISDLEMNDSKVIEEKIGNEKSSVLSGVVLYVSRKLSDIQIELNEIVIQLGGSYIWSYNDTCTHFVFSGKLNDITKEFREARSHGKKIVHPEWVYACKEKGFRVEEGVYPHTYKADMTLSQQISIQKAPLSSVPKEFISNVVTQEVTKVDSPVESKAVVAEKNEEVDFNKQLNELLVLAKSAKRRHSKRGVSSVSSSPVAEVSPVQKLQRHLSDVFIKRGPAVSDNVNEEPDTCSQLSQSYPITWDDPTGRLEREKIAARAAKIAELRKESKLDGGDDQIIEKKDLDIEVFSETKKQTTKKFMLTNIADSLKAEYEGIIKKLGGEVSEEKAFDITATHLILSNPIKNEKFLSSVASGKWVIHPQYLSASVELDKFVDEEEYEWGGPSTEKFLKNLSSGSAKIAQCPHRWRSKLQGGLISTGAFDSWKVIIVADDVTKLATYSKILEAGGAEIVPAETSESALDGISHVFVDVKKKSANKVDLSNYLSRNIKCIKPEYLAFYLIEDPLPNIDNFLVTEAKEHFGGGPSVSKRRNLSTSSSTSRQGKKMRLK